MDKNCDPLILEKSSIGSLMFADDLLVLSESKEGLQESLNKLLTYCNKWQLSVNCKKTKTMTIGSLNRKPKPNFTYKNNLLENVNEFKFLGNAISHNGNFVSSSVALSKKALKVMYSIESYMSSLSELPVTVSTHLFHSLVRPILTYNCEIWNMDTYKVYYSATWRATKSNSQVDHFNFLDKIPPDKIHNKCCKYILGLKKWASNIASRSELGGLPIDCFIKTVIVI